MAVGSLSPDSLAVDTAAADSLALDSVASAGEPLRGIMLIPSRPVEEPREAPSSDFASSWVLLGMVAVFVVASLRYRKNTRYFSVLIRDIFEMRERHNAFDDTLRETTFLWLLNILWCASAGVLLYGVVCGPGADFSLNSIRAGSLGLCMGVALAYTVFLWLAYLVVGNLFSDPAKASLWTKGYLSIQGLEAIVLFPLAILSLCTPGLVASMAICGAFVFILAKLLFIYKGFRIFFTETASWVLFLYYLCSLEIVPVVLTYAAASYLCSPSGALGVHI